MKTILKFRLGTLIYWMVLVALALMLARREVQIGHIRDDMMAARAATDHAQTQANRYRDELAGYRAMETRRHRDIQGMLQIIESMQKELNSKNKAPEPDPE